jgi:ABC-2 type transport system ATP-binding protein
MRVELKDVSKHFGGVPALTGISLEIASGERVALVGPNGSGKSTLVRAVMGMLRCEGSVRVDGEDPFAHRTRLASRLAYVPQTAPQLGATVGEVARAVTALRGLDMAEMYETAHAIDLDLRALRRRPVRELSGGMRQKLLISLALATPASLLIMDEPTASLDHEGRDAFYRVFHERAAGATLLLCSHRLDDLRRLVDRVVVMEGGRVVRDAPVTAPEVAERLNGDSWWEGLAHPAGAVAERRAS